MNRLRKKLILVVFFSLLTVFVLVFGILNASLYLYFSSQEDSMIDIISMYDGSLPNVINFDEISLRKESIHINFDEESKYRTRFFVVCYDENYNLTITDTEHIAAVNNESAQQLAMNIIQKGKKSGYTVDNYRYKVIENDDENGGEIVFLDCIENLHAKNAVMRIAAFTSVSLIVFVTVVFGIFSKRVMKPFEENSRRQKEFITNAGHELKTPLSIISANAEVLELKNGKSSWTENIIDQTGRMSGLINELLTLSKMSEMEEMHTERVDYSDLVRHTLLSFSENINCKNVEAESQIEDGIELNANVGQISQLVSILVENAVKYVSENGIIRIKLEKNFRTAVLTVFNTAVIEEKINTTKLFERFYRLDESHSSETKGYGIGLSAAKQITDNHGGNISVKQTDDGLCFSVVLPRIRT